MNIFTEIAKVKEEGYTVGFTASTFDMLHAGHVAMLQECKIDCDLLIVGLLSDPTISRPDLKNKPIQSMLERWIQLQGIEGVDIIVPFDTEQDLEDMIKILRPEVRFVGEEYEGKEHTGWNIEGTRIIYNKRRHNYGSSQLRDKIYEQESKKKK